MNPTLVARSRPAFTALLLSAALLPAWRVHGETPARASKAIVRDLSAPLAALKPDLSGVEADEMEDEEEEEDEEIPRGTLAPPALGTNALETIGPSNSAGAITIPPAAVAIEQTNHGRRMPPEILASFDGLGEGFVGPQGTARFRNPSDNTLAVGPDHIVQIVNSRMAIFTKKGKRFDTTGRVLYGPVETRNVFKGCGDCGELNNGDAVVRYDQLADRWLIVMPIFRRLPGRTNEPSPAKAGEPAHLSQPGVQNQPGAAQPLYQPPPPTPSGETAGAATQAQRRTPGNAGGAYAMCYAVSTSPDPLGSYYRYQFVRPLFPDYPRPAVWPDGYYVPTSTGDNVIQKQAYVVEREKMLRGEDASEQGFILDGVNFLNNADLDGTKLPPKGAPNIMMAAGGPN